MNIWNYHDTKMQELKQLYNKTSKQTQNRLQEIFDTFNFTTENIYNIADNKTKKRINTYIEQWKEQKLLTGYFGVLANNIYKRTRVKNSEILELLIYSAYIEEQNKLEEQEKQIMYEDANYYYEQGQQEVNKKKKPSILTMALFLALLDQPNYSGFNWKQYIEATIQYNAQQIYKQAILNMQQQKNLEIDSNEFQTIINRQNNQKLNINNDKISGAVDLQMIGLNNLAKVEGIKSNAEDVAQVEFWAVTDEHSTEMCQSMNMMRFYINKENKFDRYWGNSKKDIKLMPVNVKGLVPGINLPPIMYYWHWCRSTIRYVPIIEKQEKTSYNNTYPEFKKEKLYSSGERHYSKKEIKIIANKMYEVGNKYTDNKSKWSGNIIISNRKTNAKLWNCNIEIESITSPHAILHEQLHAHSISYYNVDTYKKYKRIEEASTELLTKEICKKENLVNITSAYDDWVECLTKINEKIKIENNTFEFAKTLYKIPVTDRLDFLDTKIQNYLVGKSIDEAIELNNLLGELYV
ncbi:MAG: hypothetical protein KIC76_06375 [Firmicutes bacterium]|nr:hypothetical protein [Bacillota bacterium]